MRKICLHEIFLPFSCRHERRHEMSPRNESFISPRHHVNTTVAQTSTRYENSCRHETHTGMSFMSVSCKGPLRLRFRYSVFISLRFRMILNRFHYSVFAKSAKRAPGTKTGVFPLLRFRSFSFPLFALVLKPRMLYRLLLQRFE